MSWSKGWKAFDRVEGRNDAGMCRGFLFEEGKEYEIEGELELCSNGFHACKDAVLCFQYYPHANLFAEVEFLGDVVYEEPTKHKGCTSKIRIVKFIDLGGIELGEKYNSGHCNSGDYNSGNRNSGNRNSGDWNSCDRESGSLNSKGSEYVRVFNKPCRKEEWESATIPSFFYFDLIAGKSYKESFQESFKKASKGDIERLKALPNFDKDVFFEISGIKIED